MKTTTATTTAAVTAAITASVKARAFDIVRDIVKIKSLEALDLVSESVKLALELEAAIELEAAAEAPKTPNTVVAPEAPKAPKTVEAPKTATKAPKTATKAPKTVEAPKTPKAAPKKAPVTEYDTQGKALELESMCEEWLECYYSGQMDKAPKVTGMMCRYRALKKRGALTENINGWFAAYSQFKSDKEASKATKGRKGRPRKKYEAPSVPTQAQVDRQANKAKSALTKTGANIGPKNSRSPLSAEEKITAASNRAKRQQAKTVVADTKQQLSKQQSTLFAAAILQLEAYAVELGFDADIASTREGLQALHVEAYGKGHEACLAVLDSVYSLNELAKPAKRKIAQAERVAKYGKHSDLDRVKALLA